MAEPTVCCVMLTRDRTEMAARAVRCFRRQTYENKRLAVIYSGDVYPCPIKEILEDSDYLLCLNPSVYPTVGALRNMAGRLVNATRLDGSPKADIICHFDDDDISHPNRISEQVALLQASGADCVGYRDMLFWRTAEDRKMYEDHDTWDGGQAWLYMHPSNGYALGTSLCYWRKTWERTPFADTSQGEDRDFVAMNRTLGVLLDKEDPRMIATIHGGNTSNGYTAEKMASAEWRRAPEWDKRVRRIMEAA